MATIREELIPIVDSLRREVVDQTAGLRLDTVTVRRRAWSGGQLGRGVATDADLVLDPRPKVMGPEPRLQAAEPGKYEAGDMLVDKVSLTYTEEQLGKTVSASAEVYWLIGDEPYRVVAIEERFLAWRVHLRRMRARG